MDQRPTRSGEDCCRRRQANRDQRVEEAQKVVDDAHGFRSKTYFRLRIAGTPSSRQRRERRTRKGLAMESRVAERKVR